MNLKQFLKVTPKGGGRAVVVPAANRDFYLAQGAKIETPTEAEVSAQFPEYAARAKRDAEREEAIRQREAGRVNRTDAPANTDAKRIADLDAQVKERDERIAALESENAQLRMAAGCESDAPETHEPENADHAPKEEKQKRGWRAKK